MSAASSRRWPSGWAELREALADHPAGYHGGALSLRSVRNILSRVSTYDIGARKDQLVTTCRLDADDQNTDALGSARRIPLLN